MKAINLLPQDAERARRTTPDPALLIGVAGFAIVFAAIFSMFMTSSSKVQHRQADRDTVSGQLQEMNRVNPPPKVLPIQETMETVQQERVGAVASALSYRIPWDYILGQIALALPSGVKLTTLQATAPLSPNPEATAEATTTNLELKGWTYSQEAVALLMKRLMVLPPLVRDSVTLVSSAQSGGEGGAGAAEAEGSADTGGKKFYEFAITAKIKLPGVVE